MQQLITERLERYTDLSYELIQDITRQVMLALDVENALRPVVMDEYNYETELEKAESKGYDQGHRVGFMDALDDLETVEVLKDDSVLHVECQRLRSEYIDKI